MKKQIFFSVLISILVFVISTFLTINFVYDEEHRFPGMIKNFSKPITVEIDDPYSFPHTSSQKKITVVNRYILPDGICILHIGSGGCTMGNTKHNQFLSNICEFIYSGLFLGLLINLLICLILIFSKNEDKKTFAKYILISSLTILFLIIIIGYIQYHKPIGV
jgi:hypothetical protein